MQFTMTRQSIHSDMSCGVPFYTFPGIFTAIRSSTGELSLIFESLMAANVKMRGSSTTLVEMLAVW